MPSVRSAGGVALVTGAARGIGRGIAERLAADGWRVFLNDVDPLVARTAEDVGGTPVVADITSTADVRAMVTEVERTGPILVLVNNAGINRDARLGEMTDEAWARVVDVNLTGAFRCVRETSRGMVNAGWGRVVSISSIGVLGARGTANYAASKAGLVALTRTAALELGSKGVTVNAIAPGVVDTEMLWKLPQELKDRLTAKIPVKRVAQPADIASVVSFLASDDAAYVTGQLIFVDGGISLGYI